MTLCQAMHSRAELFNRLREFKRPTSLEELDSLEGLVLNWKQLHAETFSALEAIQKFLKAPETLVFENDALSAPKRSPHVNELRGSPAPGTGRVRKS